VLVTGSRVAPAGISTHGPVDTGVKTVVGAAAAVPTSTTLRRSPPTSIVCPAANPATDRTATSAAPASAGAASPELASPSR